MYAEIQITGNEEKYLAARIDNLLASTAARGVRVHLLVYKEVKAVMPLNSEHAKMALHRAVARLKPRERAVALKNLWIIRDPPFLLEQAGFWSHHEKTVMVDRKRAFIGGIDICMGR